MASELQEIKEQLKNCPPEQLFSLLERYQDDSRAGVISAVTYAKKRLLAWEKEKQRTYEMQSFEREYASRGLICGIDEVGRGPLAGPVYAAAVILPLECPILYINDSKQLSEKKREELYDQIMTSAIAVGIGHASAERIDEINILQATFEAMRMAISQLDPQPDFLLNDAVIIPGVDIPQLKIIKGDAKSQSIAAASIVAKVTRDRLMAEYDKQYPEYGFAGNKGYGSAAHMDAIRKVGPCPLHRRSFIKNI